MMLIWGKVPFFFKLFRVLLQVLGKEAWVDLGGGCVFGVGMGRNG